MWLLFGVVALLAGGIATYLKRREDRWQGEAQPGGWRLQLVRNSKSKQLVSAIVGVPFDCQVDFECKPETGLDRWCKRFRFARELEVGHAPFDDAVYLICDDARLRDVLRADPALAADLHVLVASSHPRFKLKKVVCRGGTLRAVYKAEGDDADPLIAGALPRLQSLAARLPRLGAFAQRRVDPIFVRSVALLAVSSALAINALVQIVRLAFNDDTIIVDRGRLWLFGLAAGALLLLLLVGAVLRFLLGTSRVQIVMAEVLLIGTFGCLGSGLSFVRDVNADFDASTVTPMPAVVVNKFTRTHRSRRGGTRTSYYVEYRGGGLPNGGEVRVSHSQYLRMLLGMPVVVSHREGALGIGWVESIDPAP